MDAKRIIKEKWVVIDGSIYVDREVEAKTDLGRRFKFQPSVAFNVGNDVAHRIVNLHNAHLKYEVPL